MIRLLALARAFRGSPQHRLLRLSLAASIAFAAQRAGAVEPEVTSDTSAQFYDVRSPTGETVLARRRVTSTLGVAVYDLLPQPSVLSPDYAEYARRSSGEILFRARLRYDADYGANSGEANPTDYDRLVPGFSRGPVDLMYGYVEGRKLLGGWFGFKLGRQYTTDALGWWSFDGGSVRVTTPFFLAVEALGGLEVRGGLPLSTSRWERDGVWRGNRADYDPALYPSFQPSDVAPALGVAVESTGFTWIHGRLSYRRVYNTGSSNVSSFASGLTQPVTVDGTRISQERLGYSVDASLGDVAGAKAGIGYDFYSGRVNSIYGSVDGYVTPKLTLSADYDYYAPTYDADSIWNFFVGNPMNDVGLRAALDATRSIALSAGGNVRVSSTETAPSNSTTSLASTPSTALYPTSSATFDGGGFLAGRHRHGANTEGIRASFLTGREGHRNGGEVYAEHLLWGRTMLIGRASLFDWNDTLRPGRDATSVGAVAGVGYLVAPRARTQIEYQMDTNRLVGIRSRIVLWLTLAAR